MIVSEIKERATNNWQAILGLADEITDGKGHPCPQCGGTDRFHVDSDFQTNGKVYCRHCLPKGANDGIAAFGWIHGIDNRESIKRLAKELGMDSKNPPKLDLIAEVCRSKRMPADAFMQFGPTIQKRNRKDCVRVPVWNERGEIHSHFDLLPEGKGWFARGLGMSGMFFPSRLPKPGETWHLVEGVKDASALIGLGFNACGLPMSYLASKYAELFRDCHIIIVHDLDIPGQLGSQKTGGHLAGIAASIRIARLPGEVRESKGEDVRDILAKPDGERLVRNAIANAVEWQPTEGIQNPRDGRPEVLVTLAEGFVADQVVSHLGQLGVNSPWIPKAITETVQVFERGGQLVQVIPTLDGETVGGVQLAVGTPTMRPIPTAIARERITQCCQLIQERETSEGEIQRFAVPPPRWLVEAIHCRGWYSNKIRRLSGVVTSPTIRKDGSILQIEGHDAATGLLYKPNDNFPKIQDNPTRKDAIRSITDLLEVIQDFPFMSRSDHSAWLCLVLSLIARECIDGCVPLFAITANTRGAGKSLLADAASLIALGRSAARKAYDRDDTDMRKAITSVAMEGLPLVLLDNIDSTLGGASLDAAITARTWSDRILGKSATTGDLPLRTVWCATGNNIQFGSDIARRVIPIRLVSPEESPEDRIGFKHDDLLGWVSANRSRLAVSALTILRAYFVAGCPAQANEQFGSFESWSKLVRGSLVWCGADDPLATRETAKASDDSREILGLLIAGLLEADPHRFGLTAKQIETATSYRPDADTNCPTLAEAVMAVCGGRFDPRRFSRRLRQFQGRVFNGMRIESEMGHSVRRYFVGPRGGSGGSGWSRSNNLTRETISHKHCEN